MFVHLPCNVAVFTDVWVSPQLTIPTTIVVSWFEPSSSTFPWQLAWWNFKSCTKNWGKCFLVVPFSDEISLEMEAFKEEQEGRSACVLLCSLSETMLGHNLAGLTFRELKITLFERKSQSSYLLHLLTSDYR